MRGNYQRLFDLEVFHEYYADRSSNDFTFSPTTVCKKMMRGHRLLFSLSGNGFRVDYPIQNDSPFIAIAGSAYFSFVLRLENTSLFNFTKIPQRPGYTHYFTNKKIEDTDLELLTSGTAPPNKKCLYHYYAPKEVIVGRYVRADHILDCKKAFGYLGIHKSELKNEHTAIAFQTDSKVWKYHVILPGNKSYPDYIIQKEKDASNGSNNRYAPLAISFQKKDERPWHNERRLLLFESIVANSRKKLEDPMSLPFYEEGLKNLQLIERINNGSETASFRVVINHLPNPSIKKLKPEVFLYL